MAKRIEDLDKNLRAKTVTASAALRWIPAADRRLTLRGLAWWGENKGRFARLPLRAEKRVRPDVWTLAQCPASAHLAFRSDTTRLAVRAANSDTWHMPHMAVTGSNGLFLYAGVPGCLRPWAVGVPDPDKASFERELFKDVPGKLREFRLYLPLYKPLQSLELGLAPGARLLPPSPPVLPKPVVFYGTSITQGGCASTAGSDFISTVGRRLNLDVINLGFSGNGRGEPELAGYLSEIDAALYVLDYAANTSPEEFRKTLPRFVGILRKRRPSTPILIMTTVCFSQMDFSAGSRDRTEAQRDFAFEFYAAARKRGDAALHVVDGLSLIPYGVDGAYVDGVHPTDHGFMLMAERLAPFIDYILLRDS